MYWLVARATGTKVFPLQIELPARPSDHAVPDCPQGSHLGLGCVPFPTGPFTRTMRAAGRYENWVDLHALVVQGATALAVMAVLSFALGWIVAGRVLRPLRAITTTAEAISATSLHERLAWMAQTMSSSSSRTPRRPADSLEE